MKPPPSYSWVRSSKGRPVLAWSITLLDENGRQLGRIVVLVTGGAAVAVVKALEALQAEAAAQRALVTAAEACSSGNRRRQRFRIVPPGRVVPLAG